MRKLLGKFRKHSRRGEKGFTLVELLVVVAILGVVAAIAIPNIGQFIGRGTEEAANTELHNIQLAVVAFQVENNGDIPATTNFPVADDMDDYIIGGVAALQGTYTLVSDGTVTQTAYPGLD